MRFSDLVQARSMPPARNHLMLIVFYHQYFWLEMWNTKVSLAQNVTLLFLRYFMSAYFNVLRRKRWSGPTPALWRTGTGVGPLFLAVNVKKCETKTKPLRITVTEIWAVGAHERKPGTPCVTGTGDGPFFLAKNVKKCETKTKALHTTVAKILELITNRPRRNVRNSFWLCGACEAGVFYSLAPWSEWSRMTLDMRAG